MTSEAERSELEQISLIGGPLHRLAVRLGLLREGDSTLLLGMLVGLLPWIVLLILSAAEHKTQQLFSLSVIGGHLRLLVVIPLFFLCESLLDPVLQEFMQAAVQAGIVRRDDVPAVNAEIARTHRYKNSWLPEPLCLLFALVAGGLGSTVALGTTGGFDISRVAGKIELTGLWYWAVCLTVFRFLMFRWLWRLALWWRFLWRLSRFDLHLIPTHPDGAGGLGYLEVVQSHFTPLVAAMSVVQSASFAEDLSAQAITFQAIYPTAMLALVVSAVLFLSPLFFFTPQLWRCKVKGLSEYSQLATRYVIDFDEKWLRGGNDAKEPLLGTADLQSLADLSNGFANVRRMNSVPASIFLVSDLLIAGVVPLAPLFLLKFPAAELAEKFFTRLSGM